jgi:hypothetical protein
VRGARRAAPLLAVILLAGCGADSISPDMSATALAGSMRYHDYRPRLVVDAVEELRELGKDAALDRVEAESNASPDDVGSFWVLRVLFDPPPGEPLPPVRLGRPTVDPPPEAGALPRFPIVVVDDVPLLVIRGYALAGKAEPLSAHIAWYREHGRLRDDPLRPSDDAEAVREHFIATWRKAYGGDERLDEVLAVVDPQLASLD